MKKDFHGVPHFFTKWKDYNWRQATFEPHFKFGGGLIEEYEKNENQSLVKKFEAWKRRNGRLFGARTEPIPETRPPTLSEDFDPLS